MGRPEVHRLQAAAVQRPLLPVLHPHDASGSAEGDAAAWWRLVLPAARVPLRVPPGLAARVSGTHFPHLQGTPLRTPQPHGSGCVPCLTGACGERQAVGDVPFLFPCGLALPFPCDECTKELHFARGAYARDLASLCEHSPLGLVLAITLGDRGTSQRGVVGKARRIGTGCGALLPLNTPRHWPSVASIPEWLFSSSSPSRGQGSAGSSADAAFSRLRVPGVPWSQKKRGVVWRGATTGCCCHPDLYRPPAAPCASLALRTPRASSPAV